MNDDRLKNLRKMLEQVDAATVASTTTGETLESAMRGEAGEESLEVVGPGGLAEQEMAFAQESLDVFVSGDEIDDDQQFMLEAIVMPFKRPVVDVIHDKMVERQLTSTWKSLATDAAKKATIERVLKSIGRIEIPDHQQLPYAGTGFVVGPDLIMTNRHVANIFAMGLGERNLKFIPGQTSQIDFIQELDNPASDALNVIEVCMIHPFWDMALLRVSGLSPTRPSLQLSTVDPQTKVGSEVVTIGYPGYNPSPDREFQRVQSRVFRDVYYVKRMQPGELRTREVIESFKHPVEAITHDCSTLGGNSGSAVIDLASGHVIGLHFAGAYLRANYAVPAIELAADQRVVDAGVQFAGAPVTTTQAHEKLWIAADSGTAESAAATPAGDITQSVSPVNASQSGAAAVSASGTRVQVTVPLTITLDIGGAIGSQAGFAPTIVGGVAGQRPEGQELERLFGPPAKEFSLNEMASLFSTKSLTKKSFDMSTALSLAIASKFAYEDGPVVEAFGEGGFGFDTCEFIEASDTQCFIASTSKAVLIAFRGTESIGDWLLNLRALTTRRTYGDVHTGFLRGFEFVQMQLESALAELSGRRLLITGHSLGGAIATVAAVEWIGRFDVAAVYTFGQPGVGRNGFASSVNSNYRNKFFRFVNNSDVVTRVPPGYDHVGKLFHFDRRGEIKATTESFGIDDDAMMSESEFAKLQESLAAVARGPATESLAVEESVFTAVSDHGMDRYIEKVMKHVGRS